MQAIEHLTPTQIHEVALAILTHDGGRWKIEKGTYTPDPNTVPNRPLVTEFEKEIYGPRPIYQLLHRSQTDRDWKPWAGCFSFEKEEAAAHNEIFKEIVRRFAGEECYQEDIDALYRSNFQGFQIGERVIFPDPYGGTISGTIMQIEEDRLVLDLGGEEKPLTVDMCNCWKDPQSLLAAPDAAADQESSQKRDRIPLSGHNLAVAEEILAFIQGDEDTTASRRDPAITFRDGNLYFGNAACGFDENETILVERLEADSMGDGWDDAKPEHVIDWLETYCLSESEYLVPDPEDEAEGAQKP